MTHLLHCPPPSGAAVAMMQVCNPVCVNVQDLFLANSLRVESLHTVMTLLRDNLILFDGVCNFCTSSVQFIIRHDQRAVFKFVSIQSDLGREIYRSAGFDPEDIQTFMVLMEGRALIRSDATFEIVKQFGGFWRLLAVFKIVPRGLRDWVYSFIARRRYKWFGQRDSCMIPTEDV